MNRAMIEQMMDRVQVLADMPIGQIREVLASHIFYGDNPPTRSEAKLAGCGWGRGQMIVEILSYEFTWLDTNA